ncbi:MAG TPA: hypothetical protein VE029_10295 [Rhizobacter sp.]|nr:hypothetical protein [Rhizobacter sp.]
MPFIRRNPEGQIESLHRHGSPEMEFLPSGHADLMAFIGHSATESSDFGRLDADFVRVIEDVIDTLIVKNLINITDLPGEAQAKLFARKSFRERVSRNSLRLFSDSTYGAVIDDSRLGDLT